MKKWKTLQRLESVGIIAVVRGDKKGEALQTSHAIVAGGIKGIELAFTVPQANEVIRELVEFYHDNSNIIVGAGTVLDAFTARLAIVAGAQYIVSPSFDKATAEVCNLYQIPYIPGCMTITEMQKAITSGVDIIKLFPGSVYDPSILKAIKAPMPQLNIMPTGGVNLTNMIDWFNAGAIAVGVGGSLLAPAASGNFDEVTKLAKQYKEKYQEIRK
ncbi:bifunctional 4-hydroxy-2-oxoglutarate aldolase/2-dehydro-3-deoxy-phosphogluconate aldolase [Virgibacillus pantothenticus]|uniref:bifunctional 4-hydroxy-2-oxoglutarate aldolase/2-dehydro-3-deoxy-phosphogluconate aldolase n=1 Tax=Virgibacillus pantothenticus TaxID=1473 RepID=UPI0009872B42|nr:bifunctional 4-hydroxy-2-oxoglutarate aldolase/2-dehydro-3-deoxy-phosphogluconate aldolase [Virgibacillus pantothenticus]